jgi:hypothetical protein
MTRAPFAVAAVILCVAGSAAANPAPEPPPAASWILLGGTIGSIKGDVERSSLRGPGRGESPAWGGAFLGYRRRVAGLLSVLATATYSEGREGALVDAGYKLRRYELGVAPQIDLVAIPFRQVPATYFQIYATIPVGIAFDGRVAPNRRAFDEHVEAGTGWYGGAGLGVHYVERRWGGLLELGYRRQVGSERTTLTPLDTSAPPIVERRDFIDHQFVFTVAAVFAF